jgi:hypothetical protein
MTNQLLAQAVTNPVLGPGLQGKSGVGFFQSFIPAAIGLAFVIGTLIFFFILVIGAIQWIVSGGDKAAIESARGKIGNALIGIVILFSVFVVLMVVEGFFGINILTLDIGPLTIQ